MRLQVARETNRDKLTIDRGGGTKSAVCKKNQGTGANRSGTLQGPIRGRVQKVHSRSYKVTDLTVPDSLTGYCLQNNWNFMQVSLWACKTPLLHFSFFSIPLYFFTFFPLFFFCVRTLSPFIPHLWDSAPSPAFGEIFYKAAKQKRGKLPVLITD